MLNRSRVRWRCRRGTRELDLLLLRYLNKQFEQADESEQLAFLALLEWQDTELMRCLLGPFETAEVAAPIVAKIRALGRF